MSESAFTGRHKGFARHLVSMTIGFILIVLAVTNFIYARYNSSNHVIQWDVKSYYAYLPVAFIYQDFRMKFREENPEKFSDLIWPQYLSTGKPAIQMTMGMAILYSPFFLAAHTVAILSNYEADGYSLPYRFALNFSGVFYVWIGLLFLVKILRRYFREHIIAFTLVAITLGTNLFYYATIEAPMTHAANFAMITVFVWLTIKFYEKPSLGRILLPGMLAGLIALVRPNNIILLLIFFLWNIRSVEDLRDRIQFFLPRFHWVLLMATVFVLVWVPQFIYWLWVSGKLFFNAYALRNEGFYFNDPEITNILFSYRKGWLVYTPMMVFALAGMAFLPRKVPGFILSFSIFMILNVYILASWWCWWYGGTFGSRPFIDSFGLLAIPFAAFVDFVFRQKKFIAAIFSVAALLVLLLNHYQTSQYAKGYIHYDAMDKVTYWDVFLKKHPSQLYWDKIQVNSEKYLEIQIKRINEQAARKSRKQKPQD